MSSLFAERLKSARMMNGLSLQELAEKLESKISRQAIHKYETGEVIPDSEMTGLLCQALNVRPDFFTRDKLVELSEVNFRKIDKLAAKNQNIIIAKTKEFLERYLELEEIMGVHKPFEKIKIQGTIKSEQDIEKAVELIRHEWGLCDNPINNVIELLEDRNIKVILLETEDGFDGLETWINNGTVPVIVLNEGRLISADRKRFSALHELGHLLLPLKNVPEKMAEKYCHTFAAAMLFPKQVAVKEFGEKRTKVSIQELGFVKQQYGISIQALVYRLHEIGIISGYYKNYLYQHIIQMGWKIEEPYRFEGKEISNRFDQLLYRALSEEMITFSKAASLKNMKLSEFRAQSMAVE